MYRFAFFFKLAFSKKSIPIVGIMYATLPFYWNYASAFTVSSAGGISAILCDALAENARKKQSRENHLNNAHKVALACFRGIDKVIQAATAVRMMQAAGLSLGYVGFGLANYKLATIAFPLLIEAFLCTISQTEASNTRRLVDTSFGCSTMTAALISALIITKKIGCFDLLPLAMVSTSAYLTYKVVKTLKSL